MIEKQNMVACIGLACVAGGIVWVRDRSFGGGSPIEEITKISISWRKTKDLYFSSRFEN